jgi:hypothetical protein
MTLGLHPVLAFGHPSTENQDTDSRGADYFPPSPTMGYGPGVPRVSEREIDAGPAAAATVSLPPEYDLSWTERSNGPSAGSAPRDTNASQAPRRK